MDYESFQKEYVRLSKEYGLPEFSLIDKQFELHLVDLEQVKPCAVLTVTRRRIADRLSWMINIVQNILLPSAGSMISAEESKFFSDKERDEAMVLLKELMFFYRKSFVLDVVLNESSDAAYIKEFMSSWNNFHDKILKVSSKLASGWNELEKKELYQYFG